MSDYYCPNCYADLEMQDGFDPERGYWTCTECGQQLFGDDEDSASYSRRYPGVVWHCDSCDAVLNNQDGFDDWQATWTCTECGCLNFIDEDEIRKDVSEQSTDYSTTYAYDDDNSNAVDDEECGSCYGSSAANEDSSDRRSGHETATRNRESAKPREQDQKKRGGTSSVHQALNKIEIKPLNRKSRLAICLFVLAFCISSINHPEDTIAASKATGTFFQAWLTVVVHLLEDAVRWIALLASGLTGK